MLSFLSLLSSVTLSAAPAATPCVETERTVAAVRCVEDHWERAFLTGDAAYLNVMLSDEFRSYTALGFGHDRAAVVASAQKLAKDLTASAKAAANLPTGDFQLRGDTATVFWHRADGSLSSVDAFYWANRHWHGWYSQQSSPPAK